MMDAGRSGRVLFLIFLFVALGMYPVSGYAQPEEEVMPGWHYTREGLHYKDPENRFLLLLGSRLQFRYAVSQDQDPLTFDDFSRANNQVLKVNRARFGFGGYVYKPWIRYYAVWGFVQNKLLDYYISIDRWDVFGVRVGQWKVHYNRERFISSGSQQLLDRSILNRVFTVDRQQGIEIYGRLFTGSPADLNYNLSLLKGTGLGLTANDDHKLMYVGRLQWNALGRRLPEQGSDLNRTTEPGILIAVAGAVNRSPYTRFSSSGGGDLEFFEPGESGQYRVRQAVLETAFVYRGCSWQHETHYKEVLDVLEGHTSILKGSFFQGGCFPHEFLDWLPEPVEVAARYAWYYPSGDEMGSRQEETALALNWFFTGHRNKLTAEFSWLDPEGTVFPVSDEFRFALQWDITF